MMDGSLMPRSIRWRIQLGLLKIPETTPDQTTPASLSDLAKHNRERLARQRQDYNRLVEKHEVHRVHHAVVEDQDGFVVTDDSQTVEDDVDPLLHPSHDASQNRGSALPNEKAAPLDPLTAMVMEQEKQEKRLHDLDLKYRKERARRKFGLPEEERVIQDDQHHDGGDRFDTYSVSCSIHHQVTRNLLKNAFWGSSCLTLFNYSPL